MSLPCDHTTDRQQQQQHNSSVSVRMDQDQVDGHYLDTSVNVHTTEPPNIDNGRVPSPPQTSRARRGFGGRRGNTFGGPGLSMSHSSRPRSATSRRSITHTPSLTSQAFFRPMSSQRLQAQRGSRPFTGAAEKIPDVPRLSTSTGNRPSIESSSAMTHDQEYSYSPSRDTEPTEQDQQDHAYYSSSPTGANTVRTGNSSQPLNDASLNNRTVSNSIRTSSRTPKTPQSYNSKCAQTSPQQIPPAVSQASRVSRDTSSPQLPEKDAPVSKSYVGKNYEYFSGNTVFCWGGRLQNTRHRPVNILTGILILLPTILFFIFSYDQTVCRPTFHVLTAAAPHGYGSMFRQQYPSSSPISSTFVSLPFCMHRLQTQE